MKKIMFFCIAIIAGAISINISHAFGDDGYKQKLETAFEAENYQEVFRVASQYAEKGKTNAQLGLCYLHWHGVGTPENIEAAISWCEKVSPEESNAKEKLEVLKSIVKYTAPSVLNKSAVLKKLTEQAKAGNGEAQWLMYRVHSQGFFYFEKEKRKGSSEAARKWLQRAEESGQPDALIKVARKWITEQTNPELVKKFILYMERAAKQNKAEAMELLGSFYLPVGYRDKNVELPHKDYAKSTYWYRKAIENGGDGIWELAQLLRERYNPERDYDEGLKLIIQVSETDWYWDGGEAKIELAKILLDGEEVPRDKPRALRLLKAALEQKYSYFDSVVVPANYLLGMHHLNNPSSTNDPASAKKHFKAIFENRSAKYIRPGYYSSENELSTSAYHFWKLLLEEGSTADAKKFLTMASELGDTRATHAIEFLDFKEAGLSHELIENIQTELNRLGFHDDSLDVEGDLKTFNALKAFDCTSEAKVMGKPAAEILESLEKATAINMPKPLLAKRLFKSIMNLDIDCVRSALMLGADPNLKNDIGRREGPVSNTSKYADRMPSDDESQDLRYEITKILIKSGSKLSRSNTNIFSAVSDGDIRLLKLLLENDESAIYYEFDGQSLMFWAAHYDQPSVIQVLEKFGMSPLSERQKAQQRLTNIPAGLFKGSGIPIVQKALQDGAWLDGKDGRGITVLGAAIGFPVFVKTQVDLMQYLLEKGANPNAVSFSPYRSKDASGNPVLIEKPLPLNEFVSRNSYTMKESRKRENLKNVKENAIRAMRLLMSHGAKVAGKDSLGRTPLHLAAKANNTEAAKILLKAGAIKTHRDKTGATPLDYAESAKMIALLKDNTGTVKDSVRKQTARSTSGSGFFVSKLGHVITNAHVVKGCNKVTVGDSANKQVPAEVINTDGSNDLALLKLSTLEMASAESKSLIQKLSIVVVPLASKGLLRSEDVKLGEKVLVAGFPFGDFFSNTIKVTTGIVSATRGAGDDSGQFQLDAAVQPGNSGGPIYDSDGNIVGVVISQLDKLKVAKAIGSLPENVNFGIKASTVRQFMISSGLPSRKAERTEEKSTQQLAEIAQNQALMVMCHQAGK